MQMDTKVLVPKPHITIYPDFGGGAWYWVNWMGPDSLQGGRKSREITAKEFTTLHKKMPEELVEDFEGWHLAYTRNAYEYEQGRRPFDWKSFHSVGIQLSVRLKQAMGDDVRVFYEKPVEDPNNHLNQRREVLIDGQLV